VSTPFDFDDRIARAIGRSVYFAALLGLAVFGAYILLRGSGATFKNFDQWHDLVSGSPIRTSADWIASLGIGMHYLMGAVLVLARPILFSSRIGVSQDKSVLGLFDYAILFLFFVPNLLVAEYFIRNKRRPVSLPRWAKWPAVTLLTAAGLVFVYAIATISATNSGKYGKHLLSLFAG